MVKTLIKVKKYVAKIVIITLAVMFVTSNIGQCTINKRGSERIGELDRQYSELHGRTSELIGIVSGEIGEIGVGLGDLSAALRIDANDLRSIAAGVRAAAQTVSEMEDRIDSLDRRLRDFTDVHYGITNDEVEEGDEE